MHARAVHWAPMHECLPARARACGCARAWPDDSGACGHDCKSVLACVLRERGRDACLPKVHGHAWRAARECGHAQAQPDDSGARGYNCEGTLTAGA
eukprot:1523574-Alexandrium_andersonii.AAC.1